jgi:hypothetical protein
VNRGIIELGFWIGSFFYKVFTDPSKWFCISVAWLMNVWIGYIAYEISPVLKLLYNFLVEWYSLGFFHQSFYSYLMLASYSVLLLASVSWISAPLFDFRCYIKQRFGFRIMAL